MKSALITSIDVWGSGVVAIPGRPVEARFSRFSSMEAVALQWICVSGSPLTILGTTVKSLLRHVRERWSSENSWHWPRDIPSSARTHTPTASPRVCRSWRRSNSLSMNALRLDGFWSITEGLTALAHGIPGLLALLGWREPDQERSSA